MLLGLKNRHILERMNYDNVTAQLNLFYRRARQSTMLVLWWRAGKMVSGIPAVEGTR